mmetsp:Transcript_29301/g.84767  ORF Transcript_29301/g.84767 Transcript_29301/m.84767 type:complete len:169 (-) Transcript_29301:153-659(-)
MEESVATDGNSHAMPRARREKWVTVPHTHTHTYSLNGMHTKCNRSPTHRPTDTHPFHTHQLTVGCLLDPPFAPLPSLPLTRAIRRVPPLFGRCHALSLRCATLRMVQIDGGKERAVITGQHDTTQYMDRQTSQKLRHRHDGRAGRQTDRQTHRQWYYSTRLVLPDLFG